MGYQNIAKHKTWNDHNAPENPEENWKKRTQFYVKFVLYWHGKITHFIGKLFPSPLTYFNPVMLETPEYSWKVIAKDETNLDNFDLFRDFTWILFGPTITNSHSDLEETKSHRD